MFLATYIEFKGLTEKGFNFWWSTSEWNATYLLRANTTCEPYFVCAGSITIIVSIWLIFCFFAFMISEYGLVERRVRRCVVLFFRLNLILYRLKSLRMPGPRWLELMYSSANLRWQEGYFSSILKAPRYFVVFDSSEMLIRFKMTIWLFFESMHL